MKIITSGNGEQSGGTPGLTPNQVMMLALFSKLNGKMQELVLGVAEDLARSERNRVDYPSLRLVAGGAA